MKIVSIVGARPQFVKAAPITRALARRKIKEIMVHTGQHYDPEMSSNFFEELQLPAPAYDLGVGSASHGMQTAKMLSSIEEILVKEKPDAVIVYGDTNSTLAGALAAAKLSVPLVHVEAGLRSFNRSMPEELNRIVADHLSGLLLAPTETAVKNLQQEGCSELHRNGNGRLAQLARGYVRSGDVMKDALLQAVALATEKGCSPPFGLKAKSYLLASLHRPQNVDEKDRLGAWLQAFTHAPLPVVFPMHPRTRAAMEQFGLHAEISEPLRVCPPMNYLEMIVAMSNARAILTDSGGVQKEAFMLGVACITLRTETEWIETLQDGWNQLCAVPEKLVNCLANIPNGNQPRQNFYGDGNAAEQIVKWIAEWTGVEDANT